MRPFYVFDRWGKQVDAIAAPLSARHKDPITGGTDTLEITVAGSPLAKGQRIVWRDKFLRWHEHEVADTDTQHADGQLCETAYCENSISELLTKVIVDIRPNGATSTAALERVLEGTQWSVGTVQPLGTHDFSFYHVSAYEALTEVVETFGAELETTIVPDGQGVAARRVDILNHRGDDYGHLFTYGRNLTGIHRVVDTASICTALHGYGKGTETYDPETGEATGGHSRKLTFADINGGQDWVGDEDARLRYGVPDGRGGVRHSEGIVEFNDCEDQAELLELTKEALKDACKPVVSYSGSVLNFGAVGFANGEDCRTGDTVYLRDKPLDERLQGRVLEMDRDLLDESDTEITLGNIRSTFTQKLASDLADLAWLRDQSSKWNDIVVLPDAYLDAVVNRLNVLFNTTGGYVYYEKGEGLITYDRPVDQNPTMAIQITGAGFRIANERNPDGSWNWRTFGTGDGFTADEIIAGVLKGGANWWNLGTGDLRFEQGSISSTDGENFWNLSTGELQLAHGYIHDGAGKNYWNLDTGELSISSGTKVGNLALSDYVQNTVDDATDGILDSANQNTKDAIEQLQRDRLTQQAIFNTLTGGGSEQGIYLQGGRVYINATYIGAGVLQAGKIQDRQGNNYWDLETGELRLSMSAKVQTSGGREQSLSSYVSSQATTAANTAVGSALNDYVSKEGFDQLLTQQKVFNALTNNGSLKGLFMNGGELFINADFIRTGIIQGTDGNSYWNLNTGDLESTGTMTSVGQSHIMHARLTAGKFDLVMDVTAIGRLYTSTYTNNPNVHPFTVSCFTDLSLMAPGDITTGYGSTQDSTVYSYPTAREVSTNFLTDITQAGTSLTVKYRNGVIRHGLLCGFGSEGTWNVYL